MKEEEFWELIKKLKIEENGFSVQLRSDLIEDVDIDIAERRLLVSRRALENMDERLLINILKMVTKIG